MTGGYVIASDIQDQEFWFLLGLCLQCVKQRLKSPKSWTAYKASFLASLANLVPKATDASCSLEDLFWNLWKTLFTKLEVPAGLGSCPVLWIPVMCAAAWPPCTHWGGGCTLKDQPECLWLDSVKFCMWKHDLFVFHATGVCLTLCWPSLGAAREED